MSQIIKRFWILIVTWLGIYSVVFGTDFRIENRVYSGDQNEPASQSLTIFNQGMVYDFLRDPIETIVFDKADKRFIVLDDARHIRTEITTATLDSFNEKLKDLAAKNQDPLMKFLADPVFNERFDPSRNELILQSPLVNYRVIITTVNDVTIPNQYREFTDQSVKLSAILVPGSRPPFARMKLNDALARRESIPREVSLIINSPNDTNSPPSSVRSEHLISLDLTPADIQHIQQARKSMTDYKLVGFDVYHKSKN
jgi:hypothetical protein